MYVPLGIKTDYSILKSLIKVKDLIKFLKIHNITSVGAIDDNLFYVMEFYKQCKENNIKPIVGLSVKVNDLKIYLYAKNYLGYLNLLKINTIIQERELSIYDLNTYKDNILCIIPYNSNSLYSEISKIFKDTFMGYSSIVEKNNSLIITKNIVYINEVLCLNSGDVNYLKYLDLIRENESSTNYNNNYFNLDIDEDIISSTNIVSNLINLEIPTNNRYIPKYPVTDSLSYLVNLTKKGLLKRLNNKLDNKYVERLKYEINVISSMGFVDYFLIVYDYVKYAKTHNILVGPGRGSAAGSLVSYVLGITNVDPIKYNLLFERFLNPSRVTMPDIDIDFEYTKREEVINYVKEKYGHDKVAAIITFGTLASKQVIRDVCKCLEIDLQVVNKLVNLIDPKLSLKENASNELVKEVVSKYNLREAYNISMHLEGLKRHVSTHAAGIVISSKTLDTIIPIYKSNDTVLTGITMEYLEELGLLKMDFLALKNLTIIKNVLDLIKKYEGIDLNINKIPLDDKDTLDIFKRVATTGIFQFESEGMKNFLHKLKVNNFNDLVAALALFRPGPMNNIDMFIARKEGRMQVVYPDDSLESILKDTYGIMIYQEQIMQVLKKMANYTFSEADNIRRAMSKKKLDVMEKERNVFITKSVNNGYSKDTATRVYDLIIKFANYGFNKAHSVSYAMIGYQMAYLKSKYPLYFIMNLLNMSIGSEIKTSEYINLAKINNIKILGPRINISTNEYLIKDNNLVMPFLAIKGIGTSNSEIIINERIKNGVFKDYYDFVIRVYNNHVGRKVITDLINSGALDEFNINRKTLINNLDNLIDYATLCNEIDESLVLKPVINYESEYLSQELINNEEELFGFYLTNHPASKYNGKDIVKINKAKDYFDKYIKTVVLIKNIKEIKTKSNLDMAFVNASDESGSISYVIFPKRNSLISKLKVNNLYTIYGQVTRKDYDYQIVVSNIEEIDGDVNE